jgi:MYXO-CTERM domain-containing protein
MRKTLATLAVAGALLGGAGLAQAAPAPAPSTVLAQEDSSSTSSDNGDKGLWGLAGLAGLIGLVGLKKRRDPVPTMNRAAGPGPGTTMRP